MTITDSGLVFCPRGHHTLALLWLMVLYIACKLGLGNGFDLASGSVVIVYVSSPWSPFLCIFVYVNMMYLVSLSMLQIAMHTKPSLDRSNHRT